MATTAQSIIDKAERTLKDENNVHWNATTNHLAALNDGQREIVFFKPDAYVVNSAQVLVAGTKQTAPTGTIRIIDITRNMGTAGTTPGNAVTLVDMEILNRWKPGWHTDTAAAVVVHWMLDPKDPLVFYVYPKQPDSGFGYVEIRRTAVPADVAAIGNNITLGDEYANALYYFIMHRAWAMDNDLSPVALKLSTDYREAFLQSIGAKEQVETVNENPQSAQMPQG